MDGEVARRIGAIGILGDRIFIAHCLYHFQSPLTAQHSNTKKEHLALNYHFPYYLSDQVE